MTRVYTTAELARRLSVSESTLERWRRRKVGPPYFREGRTILYSEESVDAWLRENQTRPDDPEDA